MILLSTKAAPPQAWPHQVEALDFVKDKDGAMLAMEMGVGKSRVVIDLINACKYRKVLILCPLSIVSGVWPGQFRQHSSENINVVPIDNTIGPKRGQSAMQRKVETAEKGLAKGAPTAIVINYDSVWREPFASWAIKQRWDLLVMDESHRVKSPGGVASRFCSRLADRVPHRIALTGTPMPHSPLDIYAQYRALDKNIYGTSFTRFRSRYALMGGFSNHQVVGYQNLEELHQKFYSIAYRVTADQVLDLPDALDIYSACELSGKAREVYTDLEKDFIADLDEGLITAANALSRLLRLQQVTSGFARTEDGRDIQLDDAKARLLTDILEDIGPRSVVVFCRFRRDLEAIHAVSAKLGIDSYEVSGARKELEGWQRDGGILATQIQAGGLGLDLTQARYAIYYSLGFSLGDYLQSRARLHRPGQTNAVRYIHLVATNSVDETVIKALGNRQDVINSILDKGLKHD